MNKTELYCIYFPSHKQEICTILLLDVLPAPPQVESCQLELGAVLEKYVGVVLDVQGQLGQELPILLGPVLGQGLGEAAPFLHHLLIGLSRRHRIGHD